MVRMEDAEEEGDGQEREQGGEMSGGGRMEWHGGGRAQKGNSKIE
jgi:hypothetical protein